VAPPVDEMKLFIERLPIMCSNKLQCLIGPDKEKDALGKDFKDK
jgi:hypothetical protein